MKRARSRPSAGKTTPGSNSRVRAAPLLLLFLALPLQEALHRVVRAIDGDTIEVERDDRRERVRYIGIDTPETDDPRTAVRELAERASQANARLVEGRRVRLEFDVERRDRYGRLLAYVWVGDTLANEWLLREGYARLFTYPPNVRYVERFRAAQRTAREEGRGLWGAEPDLAPALPIPATEAKDHVGERATVCGEVVGARYLSGLRGRPTFLNFEEPYPEQPFTVVIWAEARSRFDEPPEVTFRRRRVCVTGTIESYRGTPQIVVEEPSQIRIRR